MAAESKSNGNGYARIGVYASAISAAALVIAAFIWIGEIASKMTENSANIDGLKSRIGMLEGDARRQDIAQSEGCRQLATVEVQMGTVETIINKTQVSNQRDIALLWDKAYGQTYPETFFAVSIPHEAMPCGH